LAYDAVDATGIVGALQAAGADTVVVASAREALERLEQFNFVAAVIDFSLRFELVAERLNQLAVPYCVYMGEPPASAENARAVMDMDQLVPVLERLVRGAE
jgi:CheY-like chemotaxis protein